MNRKGIELTLNFIVVVIISIVVLTLGILFIRNLVSGTKDIIPDVTAEIDEELQRLMIGSRRVAIAFDTKTVQPGEAAGFGLGILNTDPSRSHFTISATCSKFVPENSQTAEPSCPPESNGIKLLYDTKTLSIENNERASEMILVKVAKTARKGSYVVDVKVFYADPPQDQYDTTQRIFVTVPS